MDGPIVLDKTAYENFREIHPKIGQRIILLIFTRNGEATNTFKEYRGIVAEFLENGVRFDTGEDGRPTLYYREVGLGYATVPLKPYNNYILQFEPIYIYMWKNIDGSNSDTALEASSPERKGGKTKRKNRKSKNVRAIQKKGRSRRVVR